MPRTGGTESTLTGAYTTMVLARRRGRMRMRMNPIQSVKNQMATKQTAISNTNVVDFIAVSSEVGEPTKITGREVPVGATIYSIDVSVNFISESGTITGNFDWCLLKIRSGQAVSTLIVSPDWTNLGLSTGRNQIIKSFMSLFGTEDAGSIRYNLHIKIPKIYQRMRSGDTFALVMQSSSAGSLASGARYKYYM